MKITAIPLLGILLAASLNGSAQEAPRDDTARSNGPLAGFIREALANHPALQAETQRIEAMRHRAPQARSLPDPMLTAGWNGEPAPFALVDSFPPSSRNFGASQIIPFPGKLRLRGQIAERAAEAAEWDLESVRRQIIADVKTAYYDYYLATQALRITREGQELLEQLAEIAEIRYGLGKSQQQDVLKAQLELSKIRRHVTLFEQQSQTAGARLNTLMDRSPETPLPQPEELAPAEFDFELPTLYQLAGQNDTTLARQQKYIEQSQVAVNLAEKSHLPDFRFGYVYQQRPGLPDTHNVTVGVNLPVFYKSKQREEVLEASASLLSVRRQREAREASVQFEVKRHYLAARAAAELMQLYSQALTPQSSLALESAMSAYRVGNLEFLSVLDSFRAVLDSELDYYRELVNFQTSLARLEPLVGIELTD